MIYHRPSHLGMRAGVPPRWLASIILCAVLLVASAHPAPVVAAGVVGTGTPDSCTEAALDAALAGGGRLTFNCGPEPVTITITSTKEIAQDTTIDGGGLITISGGNTVGVFGPYADVAFALQNVTIAEGAGLRGGGIYMVASTVTITNSTFSGNSAAHFGGAISNAGTLSITNSTFSGNSAGSSGGGISNLGSLTITNSTFEGNSAGFIFMGNVCVGNGGGIADQDEGTVTITNSTFTANSSCEGGGIYTSGAPGTVTITNSTFSGNSAATVGGGIAVPSPWVGRVTIINTIVASNPGGNCLSENLSTDGGHNLDDGTSCGFSTANGSLNNTDPKLDPAGLANNGGLTQTIALQAVSKAINAGDETVCSAAPVNNLDQRGYVRPGTGYANCSIGAFEYNSSGPPPGTPSLTPTPTPTSTATRRPCVGDCDQGGAVAVQELVVLVRIALDMQNLVACPSGDFNNDGNVTVNELVLAVSDALYGCGVQPPTPRATATRTSTRTPSQTPTATPTPTDTPTASPTPVNVAGNWRGSWRSYRGPGGTLSASLTQTGSTVGGRISFTGSPCFSGGAVSGTVSGNTWSSSMTAPGNTRVDFTATASGNQITGTYYVASDGRCTGDSGTFTMTRR